MTDTTPEDGTDAAAPLPAGVADERFAANVREMRERQGRSQAEIAKLMGERGWSWHPQTQQKVESGHRKVSVGEAKALAEILGATVDQLTWPGRVASAAGLLADFAARAEGDWEQISEWTASLLHAQSQLELTVSEAERGGYLGSAEIRRLVGEARLAMGLSPEQAVAAGRDGYAELRASLTADGTGESDVAH